jgi:hypothetical protein
MINGEILKTGNPENHGTQNEAPAHGTHPGDIAHHDSDSAHGNNEHGRHEEESETHERKVTMKKRTRRTITALVLATISAITLAAGNNAEATVIRERMLNTNAVYSNNGLNVEIVNTINVASVDGVYLTINKLSYNIADVNITRTIGGNIDDVDMINGIAINGTANLINVADGIANVINIEGVYGVEGVRIVA